jgi:hypothetical protein
MPSLRVIGRFFFRLVLFYVLLMAPWPGLKDAYGGLFRAGGEFVFGSFGSHGRVRFLPRSPSDWTSDTQLIAANRKTGGEAVLHISSRHLGYVPTAFLAALVLATPISWSRRGWALLWGILLVSAFLVFVLTFLVLYAFSFDHSSALFAFSPFWRWVVGGMVRVVALAPVTWLAVPTFIWVLVVFRRTDWVGTPEQSSTKVSSSRQT